MYVYKAFKKEKIIYVGITKDIDVRMKEHQRKSLWWKVADKVIFASAPNITMSKIYELYYINKYNPKFNKADKRDDDVSLLNTLPDLMFKDIGEYKTKKTPRKPIKSNSETIQKEIISDLIIPDGYFSLQSNISKNNEKIIFLMISNYIKGKTYFTCSDIIMCFSNIVYETFIKNLSKIENLHIGGEKVCDYLKRDNGVYSFKFTEYFTSMLKNTEQKKYPIDTINRYKSSGSFRFHFLIKNANILTLSQIKSHFLVDDAYNRFFNFEKKFLNHKINDINQANNSAVQYIKIKKGKAIESVSFTNI